MSDRPPHLMIAHLDPGWPHDVAWEVECPHGGTGDDRDCKWGEEAPRCVWEAWDRGDHHPDCTDQTACLQLETFHAFACWNYIPEDAAPEHCGGFYSGVVGHAHPVDGTCGLIESIEIGYEDAWVWAETAAGRVIDGPIPVTISWPNGEYAVVTPAGVCRVCGCTDDAACLGGCAWAEPDLCTACVDIEAAVDG